MYLWLCSVQRQFSHSHHFWQFYSTELCPVTEGLRATAPPITQIRSKFIFGSKADPQPSVTLQVKQLITAQSNKWLISRPIMIMFTFKCCRYPIKMANWCGRCNLQPLGGCDRRARYVHIYRRAGGARPVALPSRAQSLPIIDTSILSISWTGLQAGSPVSVGGQSRCGTVRGGPGGSAWVLDTSGVSERDDGRY